MLAGLATTASAQVCCSPSANLTCATGQTYRIVYQTVYEQRQFTAYRIEYETVCEERQVTTLQARLGNGGPREPLHGRPAGHGDQRARRAYTVQRPVYETEVAIAATTACGTCKRRPNARNATSYRARDRNAERDESYTVMKPVYETAYRTECHTVLQPVTTCRTQYVDQGCFAEQMVLKPGWPATRLTWQSGACAVDPVTGQTVYQRPGLYWAQTPRGQYEVQKVWHPNVVAQQVQQTSYVPQTVAAAGADAGLQVRARAGRAARCRCRSAGW